MIRFIFLIIFIYILHNDAFANQQLFNQFHTIETHYLKIKNRPLNQLQTALNIPSKDASSLERMIKNCNSCILPELKIFQREGTIHARLFDSRDVILKDASSTQRSYFWQGHLVIFGNNQSLEDSYKSVVQAENSTIGYETNIWDSFFTRDEISNRSFTILFLGLYALDLSVQELINSTNRLPANN